MVGCKIWSYKTFKILSHNHVELKTYHLNVNCKYISRASKETRIISYPEEIQFKPGRYDNRDTNQNRRAHFEESSNERKKSDEQEDN